MRELGSEGWCSAGRASHVHQQAVASFFLPLLRRPPMGMCMSLACASMPHM